MGRTYHRDSKGRFARTPSGTASRAGKAVKRTASKARAAAPKASNGFSGGRSIQNIDTGKSISREAAAAIMFGSGGTRKAAAGKKVRR